MSTRLLLSQKGSEDKNKKQNMAAEKGHEVWCARGTEKTWKGLCLTTPQSSVPRGESLSQRTTVLCVYEING